MNETVRGGSVIGLSKMLGDGVVGGGKILSLLICS